MKTPSSPMQHCIFRIPPADLERAKKVARAHGLTLTELIRYRLKDLPVPDRVEERERFEVMRIITRELQHIGHNINQVTAAIHRANKQSQPIDILLAQFNVLLRSYLEAREKLKETIEKYVYR